MNPPFVLFAEEEVLRSDHACHHLRALVVSPDYRILDMLFEIHSRCVSCWKWNKTGTRTVSKTSYVSKYIKAEQLTNLAVAVFIRLSNQLIDLCIY